VARRPKERVHVPTKDRATRREENLPLPLLFLLPLGHFLPVPGGKKPSPSKGGGGFGPFVGRSFGRDKEKEEPPSFGLFKKRKPSRLSLPVRKEGRHIFLPPAKKEDCHQKGKDSAALRNRKEELGSESRKEKSIAVIQRRGKGVGSQPFPSAPKKGKKNQFAREKAVIEPGGEHAIAIISIKGARILRDRGGEAPKNHDIPPRRGEGQQHDYPLRPRTVEIPAAEKRGNGVYFSFPI